MDFKKIFKIIAVIVAIAGLAAAAYVAIKKLTAKEEPEYFDDNDFFECDNDLEIIEVKEEEAEVEEKAEEPKAAPKKKAAKKKAE
ncbi:MAG: hypothetical protein IJ927_04140 [Eubacterium sp.]|nr:hypothetical protein [Eubacterium sp.]